MTFTHILFDLDGTLTDSSIGILDTIAATLADYGIEEDHAALRRFIGPPLEECFAFYLPAEQVAEAVARYRASYNQTGLFENRVYDGVPEALARLKGAGLRLAVATSKPIVPTRRILDHFALTQYFDAVAGAVPEQGIHAKADVIRLALADLGDPVRDRCLMVGDRLHDMEGAAACGLQALGVLWGYGAREELAAYNPRLLAETPAEMAAFVLGELRGERGE